MAARLQTLDSTILHSPATPVGGWRRVALDCLTVSGAEAICHALGMVTSLLLKVLLDPVQMGIWQGLKIFLGYGNYTNLGISKAALRDYTVALGRRDTAQARRGLDLAFTFNTLTSLVYSAILLGAAVWVGTSGDDAGTQTWAIGLAMIGGLAVLSRYVSFQVTILRAHKAFERTSRLSVLEAVLTLAVCSLATRLWGVYGLYFGTLVVLLGAFLYVQRYRMVELRWAFDVAEVCRMIGVGGPILLAGTMITVFRSLDKLMILGYMSDREFQLGCYSVAIMASTQLYGLGNMLSIVMNPRYAEKYGETGDRRDVARLAAASSELHAAAMSLPAALAIVLAMPVLYRILPDYESGLPALVWLVPGTVALVLSLPASQYLVTVGRQNRALLAILPAIALAAVGNHFALRNELGLTGVAAVTAMAYLAYLGVVVAVSFWPELSGRERRRCLALSALVVVPTLAVSILLERMYPGVQADLTTSFGKAVLVTAVWVATCGATWLGGGWDHLQTRPA
ncbi:MAG: lipopolysaccharide biosynthesis protein [Thermoguttaceae bacterium]